MSTPPKWFANAMSAAFIQDHLNTLPWYKRAAMHVLAFLRIKYVPDWAIPPGFKRRTK